VTRTFRLLDGKYVRTTSTKGGSELSTVPAEEVEIYEDAWRELGSRALGNLTDEPHGIMFASHEFAELIEQHFGDVDEGDDDGGQS